MDQDGPSIQFTTFSDSESTVSLAKRYVDKRDVSQHTQSDVDDSFQSLYESVHSDLQPSSSTDDEVSEVQCQ